MPGVFTYTRELSNPDHASPTEEENAMKNFTIINLGMSSLAAVLAVGCAGTTVSERSPDAAPYVEATAPVSESSPHGVTPVAKTETTESGKQTASANEAPAQKFPHIPLPNEVKPGQRIFQFGFDKAEIGTADREVLKQHADYLKAHPSVILHIQGHTDHYGPKAYNEYLSKQRAEAVAKTLIEFGAPESQLVIDALGDTQPLKKATTTAQNRRVELQYKVLEMVHSD